MELARAREHWVKIALDTRAIDRGRARAAVARLYAAAGRKTPRAVLVLDSPLQCLLARNLLSCALPLAWRTRGWWHARLLHSSAPELDKLPAANGVAKRRLGMWIWLNPWPATGESRQLERFEADVSDELAEQLVAEPAAQAYAPVIGSLRAQLDERAFARLMPLLEPGLRREVRQLPAVRRIDTRRTGARHTIQLATLLFSRSIGMPLHTRGKGALLDAFADVAAECGQTYFYPEFAFVSDRPAAIRRDGQGRMHAADGPAIRFRDGFGVHLWKDVRVPAWLITDPQRISVPEILGERRRELRRCMIERVPPERFAAECGARMVGRDDCGTLWRRRFEDGDIWSAVEVVNGSPEPDGSHKRYFLRVPPEMRSAREAVAWTYGMSPRQYRPNLRT
jgi:hypothetical protein